MDGETGFWYEAGWMARRGRWITFSSFIILNVKNSCDHVKMLTIKSNHFKNHKVSKPKISHMSKHRS